MFIVRGYAGASAKQIAETGAPSKASEAVVNRARETVTQVVADALT